MASGKYRLRTTLRERLPEPLAARISKGRRDCGNHEWYKAAESTWLCYHCEPGETHTVPWDERELEARRLEAGAMLVRAGVEKRGRARTAAH
jgi:hypothetical protein